MKFERRVTWTQWTFGVWWWPVQKDLTIGVCVGPLRMWWKR